MSLRVYHRKTLVWLYWLMKVMIFILVTGFLVMGCSNQQSNEKKAAAKDQTDLSKINEQEHLERQKQIEGERIDSIEMNRILSKALKIAMENINSDVFKNSFIETMPDSSYNVEVFLNSDFYFTKQSPHLIIRRNTPGTIYFDVFSRTGNQFDKLLSHEQPAIEFTGDTIRDINGDNLKDLVINWYGSAGCCLKGFSNIYLLRPDQRSFSINFEFINPTFSPQENTIRGVNYGHPGETSMYKYRWRGEAVDTVEYISYERDDKNIKTGKIIVSSNTPYDERNKILKRLNFVPAEYKKIEGYDWFVGAIN